MLKGIEHRLTGYIFDILLLNDDIVMSGQL